MRLVDDGEVRCAMKATAQRAADDEGLDPNGCGRNGGGRMTCELRARRGRGAGAAFKRCPVLVHGAPMLRQNRHWGTEEGARIEVLDGMRKWYPGRVLPLQEEDEEDSMRAAYTTERALHPPTERWRAEGASGGEGDAEAEQGPAEAEAESNGEDDSGTTCRAQTCDWRECGLAVEWMRGQGREVHVGAVRLRRPALRRFGVGRSGDCGRATEGEKRPGMSWVRAMTRKPLGTRQMAERMWEEVRRRWCGRSRRLTWA